MQMKPTLGNCLVSLFMEPAVETADTKKCIHHESDLSQHRHRRRRHHRSECDLFIITSSMVVQFNI